ncbi:CAIB/BAIF family protein (plasmid) [Paraburkholderia caribensis MBA4]|uniref:CAIB/BAIF family protein n=1 Tax=Paraburkholderia caribensis MBA4 TaxID=1323664 RepID=A0A0P0RLW1_9BURK|nr:CoA transferase [Paraburkholderia caribensis]ALL69919.1 CAIB/BAIF family protein [Paraburkholderia caribensis MBA4]
MKPDFLKGIRFTDLTWAGAGPFGTKVFSDFGAEVLKIESTTRLDSVRTAGPYKDGVFGINRSGYFASRNTGKKSISLNLKTDEGKRIVRELVAQSDVVSNNFGPGAMERFGFSYDALREIKPDIIYLSMPMYGQDGPRANLLGVGMTISAVTSIMWQTAYGPDDPVGPGTHYPDHAANPYHAAFAVLAALAYRRKTGRGMKIDLSQVESTINFVGPSLVEAAATGCEPPQLGNRSRSDAPHNMFRAKGDDAWVALAVSGNAQWRALAAVMGRADLAEDASLASPAGRLAALERIDAAVAQWTAQHAPAAIVARLREAGLAVSEVASSRQLVESDPQLAHRHYWQRVAHPEIGAALLNSPPFLIDGERIELERPPLMGEHTHEALGRLLRLSPLQLKELEEQGVFS